MVSTYLSLRTYVQDLPRALARTAAKTDVAADTKYYADKIGKVKTLDDFLNDRRLFTIAMKAFGLEDMGYARAFMKKVLQSDLKDTASFANRLADPRYLEFAKAFNFTSAGKVATSLAYAQNEFQLEDTVALYSEQRVRQGIAVAGEAQLYEARAASLTSVDDLLASDRLTAFALKAAGIDPTYASKDYLRSVLTSDLDDPGSVANQATNPRYRTLAGLFSFAADGSVPPGGTAQSAAQLEETIYQNYARAGDGATPAAAAYNTRTFTAQIGTVGNVDDLLANERLFDYVLTAYGINPTTASKPMIRQVLTSDLGDPGSYANTLSDARYRTLAAAFNFETDGSVSDPDGAMSAIAREATSNRYLNAYDDMAVSGENVATVIYSRRMNTTTTVDAFLKDANLYDYALSAFGLDPDIESKSTIRRILMSDLTDKMSFANRQSDPRYRDLAAAFNFGPSGTAQQPREAQTEAEELATIGRYATAAGAGSKDEIANEGVYYHNTISRVRSLDDLLADKRLVAYLTKAYGLEGANATRDTLKRALTSDPFDKASFVNRPGTAAGLRDLAAAFNFTKDGAIARAPAQSAQDRSDVVRVTSAYVQQSMETDAGAQNEGVRLALYFQRKATDIRSPMSVLADKALLKVVQTALGLPTAMSQATIEAQAAMISKRLDVADFQDPRKLETFLARFSAMYDLETGSAGVASSASLLFNPLPRG